MALDAANRGDVITDFFVEVFVASLAVLVNCTVKVIQGRIGVAARLTMAADAGRDIIFAGDIVGRDAIFVMVAIPAAVPVLLDVLGVGKINNTHAMLFKSLFMLHGNDIGALFQRRIDPGYHKKRCNTCKK